MSATATMPGGRLRRWLGNGLVQALLAVVGLIWVTPVAGLLLSSLR